MQLTDDQLKALDLKRNLAVTAGAGSGKTTVLVMRYLHILLQNSRLDVGNVLAITFTEKAAAEMKDRIFYEINTRFQENDSQRERLFHLLNQLHDAQIFTIHAFCSNLLRQYPVEAGINPDFSILDEVQIEAILRRIFSDFFYEFKRPEEPGNNFILSALREFSIPKLRSLFTKIYKSRAILFPHLQNIAALDPAQLRESWERIFVDYHNTRLQDLMDNNEFYRNFKILISTGTPAQDKASALKNKLSELIRIFSTESESQIKRITALVEMIRLLTKSDGHPYARVPGGKKFWGNEGADLFIELSRIAADYSQVVLAMDPEREIRYSEIITGFVRMVVPYLEKVESYKYRKNLLDFDDLQLGVLALLQNHPDIANQIRNRYSYILVDEFQDTDTLQSNIIGLLSKNLLGRLDSNKLFIVGDPQQSIFAFRNADIKIFNSFMELISNQGSEDVTFSLPQNNRDINISNENLRGIISLQTNFRSNPMLINFFNRTFESIFKGESEFDVEFKSLDPPVYDNFLPEPKVQLDLFLHEDEEKENIVIAQVKEVIDTIINIVGNPEFNKSAQQGKDIESKRFDYGDIAVLVRSRNHLDVIESEFRERGIPYLTYKGKGFYQQQEILEIYYMLRSLTDPDDDFAAVCFFRSGYLGFSDIFLFYLSNVKGNNYWEKLFSFGSYLNRNKTAGNTFLKKFQRIMDESDHEIKVCGEEIATIQLIERLYKNWHDLAIHGRYSQLLDSLIEQLQIRPLLRMHYDAGQKLANLDKLVHYVFELESGSSPKTTGLLETFKGQITGELKEGEALIMAEEENKVKILTCHSAKGMEFPVVFFPFLERKFKYNSGFLSDKYYGLAFDFDRSAAKKNTKPFIYQFMKYMDVLKINAEEKRLFYVAATRAKDYLFLSGAGDSNGKITMPSYLNWLINAHQIPIDKPDIKDKMTISPREPLLTVVTHFVDKFSQKAVEPDSMRTYKERRVNILNDTDLKYQIKLQERPDNQIYTVTQLMLFEENKQRYFQHFYLRDGQIFPPQTEWEFMDEPAGALWGSAAHKLLEDFHLRMPEDDNRRIEQLINIYGIAGKTERMDFKKKSMELLQKVRNSNLKELLSDENQYCEYSVEMKLEPFILRGILDRLFLNPERNWEVVDFKTNRISGEEVTRTAAKYNFQMDAYALFLSALFPEQKVYPVTLYFLECMQHVKKSYRAKSVEVIRKKVLNLMNELFQIESEIFS